MAFQSEVTSASLALGNKGQIVNGFHSYCSVIDYVTSENISVGEFAQTSINENEVKATNGKAITGAIVGVVLRDSLKNINTNTPSTIIPAGDNVAIINSGNVYIETDKIANVGDFVFLDSTNGDLHFSDRLEAGYTSTGWSVFIGNTTGRRGVIGITTAKEVNTHPLRILTTPLRILTSQDARLGYWRHTQPSVSVGANGTLTIGNAGGYGAIMLPANIKHFEATTNGKNFVVLVAGDDNGGVGFFAQPIQDRNGVNCNGYYIKSNNDANFTNNNIDGYTRATRLNSAKLVIDIVRNNVKVTLGEQVIFNADVSGGVGGDSTYTKPRIGFGASWSYTIGNIVFNECKVR